MDLNEHILSTLVDGLTKSSTQTILCRGSRYTTYPIPLSSDSLIIRPMKHLVSAPLHTRRRIYSPLFVDQKINHSYDTPVRNMLKSATRIMKQKYGELRATRWEGNKYDHANSIIISEGVLGLFHGAHSFLRIRENNKSSAFDVEAVLEFDFLQGFVTIAKRSSKYGEDVDFLEGWEVEPMFEELFQSLIKVYSLPSDYSNQTWTDLFYWSDMPFDVYPQSLVKKSVADALTSFGPLKPNRSILILFLSISSFQSDPRKEILSQLERISLKRLQGRPRVIWAPRFSDTQSDSELKIMKIDQLSDSDFEIVAMERLKHLGLIESGIFNVGDDDNRVDEILHQGVQDQTDESFLTLACECWMGTWSNSLEIEGEHLMS